MNVPFKEFLSLDVLTIAEGLDSGEFFVGFAHCLETSALSPSLTADVLW